MSDGAAASQPAASAAAAGWGWYLYGIVRRGRAEELAGDLGPGLDGGEPVHLLPLGDLAAVVSLVPLADFSAEALAARLRDEAWLEALVRGHERVVEAVHRAVGILPAKLGCVYSSPEDLLVALARGSESLLAELDRLAGHDEWGVRLYAHRPTLRRQVAAADPRLRQLQCELAGARPGRAFFLQRKAADLLDVATEEAIGELARAAGERLARHTVARHLASRAAARRGAADEAEVLRAAYLIRRGEEEAFLAELQALASGEVGLRCEYNGPWPPYSFVAGDEEAAR